METKEIFQAESTVGERLRAARARLGKTQSEVCGWVNYTVRERKIKAPLLTQATLSAWEKDRQIPSLANAPLIIILEELYEYEPHSLVDFVKGDISDPFGSARINKRHTDQLSGILSAVPGGLPFRVVKEILQDIVITEKAQKQSEVPGQDSDREE